MGVFWAAGYVPYLNLHLDTQICSFYDYSLSWHLGFSVSSISVKEVKQQKAKQNNCNGLCGKRASLVAQMVKSLPAVWETWVWSLGQEDPLEREMATHSSTLAWKIPWTEEPGRLQSMGSQSRTWLSDITFYEGQNDLILFLFGIVSCNSPPSSLPSSHYAGLVLPWKARVVHL